MIEIILGLLVLIGCYVLSWTIGFTVKSFGGNGYGLRDNSNFTTGIVILIIIFCLLVGSYIIGGTILGTLK